MTPQISHDVAKRLGPSGYYLGLRIRFAFPATEINHLPASWVDLYSRERFFFGDPALKWSYAHSGAIRWRDLAADDPLQIVLRARDHGLWFGAVAAWNEPDGTRSYGLAYRVGQEYEDAELAEFAAHVRQLHHELSPPTTLTAAELAVLRMLKAGGRLKEIAFELGVTESAIKQRLKNARTKLGANNATHAATLASQFGLI